MSYDKIDQNLFDAWVRVGEMCRRDPEEALRRSRRRFLKSLSSPPRPWCLCIRAADTRITPYNAAIEFAPETELRPGESTEEAVDRKVPHLVWMTGDLVRDLTKPVSIDWPGVPTWEAARMLGIHADMVRKWVGRGYLFLQSRARGSMFGHVNVKEVLVVYSSYPIDPSGPLGRGTDRLWGTICMLRYQSFPIEFEQQLERVPRWHVVNGKKVFRGWDWICPGRIGPQPTAEAAGSGTFTQCGRRVRHLYAPLPIWTMNSSTGQPLELELPADSGLAGTWLPGLHEAKVGEGRRSFACNRCWNVQGICLANHVGWNHFVSYMTGGLLYGHEVERPLDEVPKVRRCAEYRQRVERPSKRAAVLEGLLRGEHPHEIAGRIGLTRHGVHHHVKFLYKLHGVHSRAELVAKLGGRDRDAVTDQTMPEAKIA